MRTVGTLAVLILGHSIVAQVTGEVVTLTPLRVSNSSLFDSLPANTVLVAPGSGSGRSISVSGGNWPYCYHLVDAGAQPKSDPAGLALSFSSSVWATGLCPTPWMTAGRHSVLMRFAAPSRIAGTLVIDTNAIRVGLASYAVDVGNDGTVELQSGSTGTPGHLELPVVVDPNAPVLVRVEEEVSASFPSGDAASAVVTVHFGEGARLASYGSACGASGTWGPPRFQGYKVSTATGNEFRFYGEDRIVTAPPAVHFYVIGTQRWNVPILPTRCPLLTSLDIIVPVTRDASYFTRLIVPVPSGIGAAPSTPNTWSATPVRSRTTGGRASV